MHSRLPATAGGFYHPQSFFVGPKPNPFQYGYVIELTIGIDHKTDEHPPLHPGPLSVGWVAQILG